MAFPTDVLAEAAAAARAPRLPDRDATDLDLITIDPPGSRDLDQAMHLSRRGSGYLVQYAIADVAAFVKPGGAVDAEAHERCETYYAPDENALLHPPVLSQDKASLLPGQVRPALLWSIDVDSAGEGTNFDVKRALVRSRAQLDYASAQATLDSGVADEQIHLLREIGELRLARERDRGAVTLDVPDQVVDKRSDGYSLEFRAPLPVERWNAQISLLTGMAAAQLMLYAEVGVLRTLPTPDQRAVARLRRTAAGLGVRWPERLSPEDFIRTLDPAVPTHAAVLNAAAGLLQGAGYTSFDGGVPEHATHAGVASEYAHATAPLRRLVDRYVGEVCVSICADVAVPEWVRAALPKLPARMEQSAQRAHQYEAGIISIFEAAVLGSRIGGELEGVVVETDRDGQGGKLQAADPAVVAHFDGHAKLGARVRTRIVSADMERRQVRLEVVA